MTYFNIIKEIRWAPQDLQVIKSNIFSSETTGPIELKFHMETP